MIDNLSLLSYSCLEDCMMVITSPYLYIYPNICLTSYTNYYDTTYFILFYLILFYLILSYIILYYLTCDANAAPSSRDEERDPLWLFCYKVKWSGLVISDAVKDLLVSGRESTADLTATIAIRMSHTSGIHIHIHIYTHTGIHI